MEFKYECHIKFMELLVEYTKTKSEKKKKKLAAQMEALRNGLMPIDLKEIKYERN